jgi:hypothetical protein
MARCAIVVFLAGLLAGGGRAQGPAPSDLFATAPPTAAPFALGEEMDPGCHDLAAKDPYRAGACSVQFLAGYFPMTDWGPVGPKVDHAPLSIRAGVMLNDADFHRACLPGCCELLLDYTYSPIVHEFGNYLTGPSLILRYTHCDPRWLFHPYFQWGAGLVFTDAHRSPVYQELIGQSVEFLLRVEVGARVMLTESVSLDVEGGYQHISNAGRAERNGGINNLGVAIGLTYSFGRP